MLLTRIVLCLALLAPCVGLAQAPEGEPSPAPTEALPPPPLLPAPEQPEESPPEGELIPREYELNGPLKQSFSASRAMLELIGGGAVGAGMAIAGGIFGGLVFSASCEDLDCLGVVFVSGLVGATFGVPLGVYGAGRLMDGRGQYWPTFLGTLVGAGLGLAGGLASQNEAALVVGLTFGPVLGAMVGYELSHAYQQPAPRPARFETGFQLHPAVGFTPGGGLLGSLSGRF
ncbi:hypothetical protein [Hyalangium rubrum]|uniref:Uncharacterized protein n=1 Tax=Hyalangium rubrum TaxID=3103134 RepID=A0ABU5HGI3_9BACT|nr:hypothetical protein [Hyalangium sp. s54d21]MDY7231974.1 hypothetical protein [Hyalangium sp. s54d21]